MINGYGAVGGSIIKGETEIFGENHPSATLSLIF
jgi:hypothetical protein